MRFLRFSPISAALSSATTTSAAIDMNQILKMSAQVIASAGTSTGSLQLQVSNDSAPVGNIFSDNTFTNWSNLGSPITVSAAGNQLIAQQDMCYRALRAVYTSTFSNVSTITAIADVGVFAVTVVSVPATASATQADYAVLSTTSGAKVALWLDIDAAGTAPTGAAYLAAGTKIKVSIIGGGTAAQNGLIFKTALDGVGGYTAVDNGDGTVTATQTVFGAVTAPAKHNANDSGNGSFTFSGTVAGHADALAGRYILASSVTADYYFWFKVSGIGVDPMIAGRTGIEVDVTASDTAVTIGGLVRSAAASKGWTVTGSNAVAILTNSATGPTLPAADGSPATGFTIANTQPTGSISVSLMCLGL